jgi:putative oxidoreductase
MDLGLLVVRVVVGLVMAAHGAQKLFGWFGGHGLAGVGGFFEQLGFRPGRWFALAAGLSEFGGGLLLALGLLGPVSPALLVSVMIVAAATVHWPNGLFATTNGIELPLLYGTITAGLALTGFGQYSLDHALGLAGTFTPAVKVAVLGLAIVGGFANLALRRPTPVTA